MSRPSLLNPAAALAGVAAALTAACAASAGPGAGPAPGASTACCSPEVLARGLAVADRFAVRAITRRRFNHAEFWRAAAPALRSPALRTGEVGRSIQGRALQAVTYGRGATVVLLWSQMHGDESTASMALLDIFRFLAEAEGDSLRERLGRELTLVFVPVLNPDGAELFQRENAAGVDINRDARRLATPEGRALKALRDSLRPAFGFNLHDQSARTRAGAGGPQAGIALLAPPFDSTGAYDDVRSRARLVASVVARTLAPELPGRIARYDDSFNPRAFGDLMTRWGTSTVLIESGAIPDDPQKQRLRALHVAGILAALDAVATGEYAAAGRDGYDRLPVNTGGASDLLILGGDLVLPGRPALRADIAVNYDDPVSRTGGRVREVGDLEGQVAIDTVDAAGLFLHPAPTSLEREGGAAWLRVGAVLDLDLRRGAERSSPLVRRLGGR